MVYCGMGTASKVFLIFTTQLCSCLCDYDAIVSYIDKEKVMQQEFSKKNNTPFSSLPVGSKRNKIDRNL